MSLTTKDLQAIGELIDQKLEQKLNQKFEQKLKPIKRELRKIKQALDSTISFFDREEVDHSHRLAHLEDHVGLPRLVRHH